MDRLLLTEALGRLLLTEALGRLLLIVELDRDTDRCLEGVLLELVTRADLPTERAGAQSGKIAIIHAKTNINVILPLIMHLLVFWCLGSPLPYLHYIIILLIIDTR